METNRVELTGYVGKVYDYQFSLCVQDIFTCASGDKVIQQTWVSVRYIDAKKLSSGDNVNVVGRLCTQGYIDSEGNDRKYLEVIANQVNKL